MKIQRIKCFGTPNRLTQATKAVFTFFMSLMCHRQLLAPAIQCSGVKTEGKKQRPSDFVNDCASIEGSLSDPHKELQGLELIS